MRSQNSDPKPETTDMSFEKIDSGPAYLFRRMHQISVANFTEECALFDLTCLQFSALARICDRPGIDVTRLSEIMKFDRATLGGVIERLEAKGYITRDNTPEDKRIKLLKITRQGRKLLKAMVPAVEKSQSNILRGLAASEQDALLHLLTRLVELNADTGQAGAPQTERRAANVYALRRGGANASIARARKAASR